MSVRRLSVFSLRIFDVCYSGLFGLLPASQDAMRLWLGYKKSSGLSQNQLFRHNNKSNTAFDLNFYHKFYLNSILNITFFQVSRRNELTVYMTYILNFGIVYL